MQTFTMHDTTVLAKIFNGEYLIVLKIINIMLNFSEFMIGYKTLQTVQNTPDVN